MDYAEYQAQQQQQQQQSQSQQPQQQQQQPQQQQQSQSSPQRVWAPQLLTTSNQSPFPSPTSSSTYYFPHQSSRASTAAASPANEPRPTTANLSLNMSSLTVTSPTAHSPIGPLPHSQGQQGPFQEHVHHAHPHAIPQHPHHAHSHSHSSSSALSVSPITPVSPQNFSPAHLSTQPAFTFNFEDTGGAGLSPNPDPLTHRRLSTGSHSTSSSELAVEKSVPRKRSLTGALPASHTAVGGHPMHSHSHSHSYSNATSGAQGYTHGHGHSLPHPIITTTASSPPPPASPTSPSSSHASHSFSLSHSHSHSSLSQQSASQSTSHSSFQSLDVNAHASAPYDEMDGSNPYMGDDVSDDEYGTAFTGGYGLGGSYHVSFSTLMANLSQKVPSSTTDLTNQVRVPASQALTRALRKVSWGNPLPQTIS